MTSTGEFWPDDGPKLFRNVAWQLMYRHKELKAFLERGKFLLSFFLTVSSSASFPSQPWYSE
jgi:hypothetical protein